MLIISIDTSKIAILGIWLVFGLGFMVMNLCIRDYMNEDTALTFLIAGAGLFLLTILYIFMHYTFRYW